MGDEREVQGGTGDAPEAPAGIDAAARMGADLAARGEPDGGADDAGRESTDAEVVGPRHMAYFLARFRRFDARGGRWTFTWNWPALFFPLLWLLYRKMYAWGAALLLVELVIMPAAAASPGASLLVTAAVVFGVPASANWLYFRHVRKVVARSREAAASDAERRAWRQARGGVSWVGPVVVTAVSLVAALWAVTGGDLVR